MQCLKCGSRNPAGAKYCLECGSKFELGCPSCGKMNTLESKFCSDCGFQLKRAGFPLEPPPESKSPPYPPQAPEPAPAPPPVVHERRYVTALFTDLSGYTAISEKLDPEEVKELMSRIFGQITRIVTKYEGYI